MKKAAFSKARSLYSVHPGVAMMMKWVAELREKTGRTLEEWISLVQNEGPPSEEERRTWLKQEYGMGTNASWWIAERAAGKADEDSSPEVYLQAAEKYVEEMFAGSKAGLRPLYDALLRVGLNVGKDAKACPCKTMVPLYRNHVFAELKPSTRTRLDLGLALGNRKATGRLIDTGGFAKKDRITHRIPITTQAEIDDEVKRWLKTAYDLDA